MFRVGENLCAKCWYSSCDFIVHGMKYILLLCLCEDGCLARMFGMGPGLASLSPHRRSNKYSEIYLYLGRGFLCLWCFFIFLSGNSSDG